MSRKRSPLRLLGAVAILVVIAIVLTPAMVVAGVRSWLWWTARQQNLTIDCANVDAPLWRPVVLHDVRVRTKDGAAVAVEIDVGEARLWFNLPALFGNSPGRLLRELSIERARVAVRNNPVPPETSPSGANWTMLSKLLADSFKFSDVDVAVENGTTRVHLRDLSFAASELEPGPLVVGEIAVTSPLVARTFPQLRGAAAWQNNRLTLGALSLTRGIDIDAVTADLSRLASRRIDLAVTLDAFGGKLRADMTSDDRATGRVWTVAGSASGISLAQLSEILGWNERAGGIVRASKFTFRGAADHFSRSTASLWLELNDLTWRERSADTIMLGASLHNREVHVDQVYVKQRENQFTLSGDSALAADGALWPLRDFSGYLSASIPDLDAFARLFGAERNTFSGDINVEAAVGLADRQFRAVDVSASGEVRISNARLNDNARASAYVALNGSTAMVQSARIEHEGGALELHGEVDVADLSALRARLFPTTALVNLTANATEECVDRLEIAAAAPAEGPQALVEQAEIRGGLFTREWRLSLHQRLPEPEAQDVEPSVQTVTFCFGGSETGRELRFAIAPAPPATMSPE